MKMTPEQAMLYCWLQAVLESSPKVWGHTIVFELQHQILWV